MKSIIDVYEGILGDIDINIDNMDSDINSLNKLGYNFKFDKIVGDSCDAFNVRNLRKLVSNIEPLKNGKNPDIASARYMRGKLDNEKIQLVLQWLDNLDISQFSNSDWNKGTYKEFTRYVLDQAIKQGIFNDPKNITVYCNNLHSRLEIFIFNLLKTNKMIAFRYE